MTTGRRDEAPVPAGASSPYARFDRYTRWTLYSVLPLAPLASLLLLARADPNPSLAAAHGVAIVLAAGLCIPVLRDVIGARPARRLAAVAPFATACATAAVLGALAAPPAPVAGIDVPTGLVLVATGTFAFGFSPAVPWRRVGWLALGVAAPPTLAWLLLHPGMFGTGRWFPVAFSSYLAGVGILLSGALAAWTLRLMQEQLELTEVRSELAVAEERLRFSRDLHDIFGRTLTAVAVKSDLAAELADAGQVGRAALEMREVHALAEEGLREVRAVVAGYRAVDLDAELRGARAMLTSAGIRTRLIGDAAGIGPRAAEALAWAVREGTTNVVHHSEARECTITLSAGAGRAGVTIVNDGATPRPPRPGGGGLEGLRGRLERLGGTVGWAAQGNSFTLAADVPEETA